MGAIDRFFRIGQIPPQQKKKNKDEDDKKADQAG
jgi:hypothetical protein